MKYYVEVQVTFPKESSAGFTVEASDVQHALQRISDFFKGVRYTGVLEPGEVLGIRTKPTRGVEYKELLK